MLRAHGPHLALALLAAGALLWRSPISDAVPAAGFFGFAGLTALLAMVSSVLGPFAGGNEAEWTMYLEKALKAERDRLIAMFNTMEEGVAIIGPDHKIRFMNPSMTRDFGNGIGALCYRHLYGFDEPCDEVCKLPQVIRGSTERWDYTFADGRTYDMMAAPFADSDESPCMLATFRNVTRQKQVELELIKLNRLKSELLSNVSHELKSPLTSIKGIISSLLQEDIRWDDATGKMLLAGISEESDRLASLVTNLLNMSKLEAGVWNPEKEFCDISEIIRETLERQKWVHKSHTFEADLAADLPEIYADSSQIKQVLINLLENAAAYSEEGTKVVVRARAAGGEIEVSVSDQGIGMPTEELEKVFDKFYRGSQKRRRPGGTGLGLAICKSIVLAHGGRIWAESQLEKGSTFRFTLPAAEHARH